MTLPRMSLARLVVGVVLGCLLGALGLPRLNLPALPLAAPAAGVAEPTAGTIQAPTEPQPPPPTSAAAESTLTPLAAGAAATAAVGESTSTSAAGGSGLTSAMAEPTLAGVAGGAESTVVALATGAPAAAGQVLIDERFGAPLAGWPNDPGGTAWFASGAFHLFARQPNHFVAVGVPLASPVGNAVLSAQFHKVGGPAGGGYGLIIRDQSPTSDRDGTSQAGEYLAVAIGDRGDIGVWQRDQTHWIDVVPWTHSEIVHPDLAANSLVVTTHGMALRVEVNGQQVADLTYERLPATGGAGIFVGGDLNQVALDWLRIAAAE